MDMEQIDKLVYRRDYIVAYDKFVADAFSHSPANVGEFIVVMGQFFTTYNNRLGVAKNLRCRAAEKNEMAVDAATGKAVSSSKAKVITDATEEAQIETILEKDVENIGQTLMSLRNLQRGLEIEYTKVV